MLQGHKGGIKGLRMHQLIEVFCHLLWNWLCNCRLKCCQYGQYINFWERCNSRCLKPEREKSRKKNYGEKTRETGNGANERAVSRFYFYDSCFSISSWRCLHDSSQRPNAVDWWIHIWWACSKYKRKILSLACKIIGRFSKSSCVGAYRPQDLSNPSSSNSGFKHRILHWESSLIPRCKELKVEWKKLCWDNFRR